MGEAMREAPVRAELHPTRALKVGVFKNLTLQDNPLALNLLRMFLCWICLTRTKVALASADIMLLLPSVNEFLWAFRKSLRLGTNKSRMLRETEG
jgi:hypothetical protein